MAELSTKEKFLKEGKKEFLKKGFKEASLRQICKNLGLTQGAFYGCFRSKEDLFDCIVSKPADEMLNYYISMHRGYFSNEPSFQKEHVGDIPNDALNHMIEFMYQNYDVFKLIFCCSVGTKYENYIEGFIAEEVESTKIFLKVMAENNYFKIDMDEQLIHILSSMLLKGLIEMFEHDMSYEYAVDYANKLQIFYSAGWMKLFEG